MATDTDMTTKEFIKQGDPVFNARGIPVGVVTEVDDQCFAIAARPGHSLVNEPLQVEMTLPGGEKAVARIPDSGVATYVGEGGFEL